MLSDVEFEAIAADILGADLGVPVERFAAGADGGIDLRWDEPQGVGIGQCKHYQRSTYSQLLSSAKKEVAKVSRLNPQSYKFVTSFDLTVAQKQEIYQIFASWMSGPRDVIGAKDIDGLLTRHPDVERRHAKLWVSTGLQLFWATNSAIANRAANLKHLIERSLPRYVVHSGYGRARELLKNGNVCIISGAPGIGKTSLSWMLAAEYISAGFEPIDISEDINEAWTAMEAGRRQIFLYDDFLGQISFDLGKNEDSRLSAFVERVSESSTKKLILTTREYVLKEARNSYERLGDLDRRYDFILSLGDYTRHDRAHILYNHLWHSNVSPVCLREISSGGYRSIIDHKSYNPRFVAYCTGRSFNTTEPGYPRRVVEFFNNPEAVWRVAFSRHISTAQRCLLLVLASFPGTGVTVDVIRSAHEEMCRRVGLNATDVRFRECLEVLEGTFISISKDPELTVTFANPSWRQFALNFLVQDRTLLRDLIRSAWCFEQVSTSVRWTIRSHADQGDSILVGLESDITKSLQRTFHSPASRASYDLLGATLSSGVEESRVAYCIENSTWLTFDPEFITASVEELVEKWDQYEGSKEVAERVLRLISEDWPNRLADRAHLAVDHWLQYAREDCEDWIAFLDHQDEYRCWDDATIQWEFEEFAENYVRGWGHDGELEEMVGIAARIGLDRLADSLAEEIDRRSEEYEGGWGQRTLSEALTERASERQVDDLFGRLGRSDE
ncbi:hypothetical protein PUR71_33175 [Streptomyces sp. SP17BM10]|uniref:nSTAND3 domain-containing NTPase n=1 Tax=Streptomyces sp. SP17BM10 TaxID=3002530 RepID=UPI002E784FC1|nr:hypothetical protein [Streptomyces sp. SP17BM10]MEE1787724.1 hypothetical protein [Streptomyces sp. SP17BM10]